MKCYACDTELDSSNRSEEHIIINAAGGRLKSKDLICRRCNSDFGESLDAALSAQLNLLANQLMIKRERGMPQPIVGRQESTGDEMRILADGSVVPNRPKFKITEEGNRVSISCTVRDKAELRMVAAGLVKKYPSLKMEDIIASVSYREEYLEEPLAFRLSIGGQDVFRAVCKCAVNYFVYSQGDVRVIKPLLGYMEGKERKEIVRTHYREGLYELGDNECFHMIHLRGNQKERVLYCYVDYFNVYKHLVLLSDTYDGADINATYCFDVLNSEVVDRRFMADYDRAAVIGFFENRGRMPFEMVEKAFMHTVSISQRVQKERYLRELLSQGLRMPGEENIRKVRLLPKRWRVKRHMI